MSEELNKRIAALTAEVEENTAATAALVGIVGELRAAIENSAANTDPAVLAALDNLTTVLDGNNKSLETAAETPADTTTGEQPA